MKLPKRTFAPDPPPSPPVTAPDGDLAPAHIRQRATGNTDPEAFRSAGRQIADVYIAAVEEYLHAGCTCCAFAVPRVLDWGCGPGRVASQLLAQRAGWDLYGCDVDHEAAAWCNEHLRPGAGAFKGSGPLPPLPFQDGRFDVVIATSVFTHLKEIRQHLWLGELRRVLRPGGLLLASVHGEPARRIFIPAIPTILEDNNGIFDELVSRDMDGVIPRGGYRVTFQSESWTRETWGKYLDVIEYRESGLTPEHDLVICRKPR